MASRRLKAVPAAQYSADVARWNKAQLTCRDESRHDFDSGDGWDVTYVRGGYFYFWQSTCHRGCGVTCRKITYANGEQGKRILSYTDPDYLARHGRADRREIRQRRTELLVTNTLGMASEEELLYPDRTRR